MRKLIGTWNPTRGLWETGTLDLLSEHSEPFSETWPTWGMTRSGVAFELPTRVPHMDGSASSSLPTPRAVEAGFSLNAPAAMRHAESGMGSLTEVIGYSLLKTPTSQLAINGGSQHPDKRKAGGHGPTLADEVEHLLPTPAAMNPNDGEGFATWEARRLRVKATGKNGNGFGTPLAIAVQLLPTPKAGDGEFVSGSTSGRPVEKSTHLGTIALLQAGHLEHRRTGADTNPQSEGGSA